MLAVSYTPWILFLERLQKLAPVQTELFTSDNAASGRRVSARLTNTDAIKSLPTPREVVRQDADESSEDLGDPSPVGSPSKGSPATSIFVRNKNNDASHAVVPPPSDSDATGRRVSPREVNKDHDQSPLARKRVRQD